MQTAKSTAARLSLTLTLRQGRCASWKMNRLAVLALVLAIVALDLARLGRDRLADLADELHPGIPLRVPRDRRSRLERHWYRRRRGAQTLFRSALPRGSDALAMLRPIVDTTFRSALRVGTEHAVGNDSESGEIIKASYVIFGPGYVDVSATEPLSAVNENKSPG